MPSEFSLFRPKQSDDKQLVHPSVSVDCEGQASPLAVINYKLLAWCDSFQLQILKTPASVARSEVHLNSALACCTGSGWVLSESVSQLLGFGGYRTHGLV